MYLRHDRSRRAAGRRRAACRLRSLLLTALTCGTAATAEALDIDFERIPGSPDFDVSFAAAGIDPATVIVEPGHGRVGPLAARDGRLRARVTPARTGRLEIAVRVDGRLEAQRTALVMAYVHDDWNQPEPLGGLVNTPGWEDGAAVSADGQWLALQYFPVAIDCIMSGKPDSRACRQAIGPTGAPARPAFPGASRIDGQRLVRHGCPSIGVEGVPFPLPPTSLYLFRRAADGRFIDPAPIYWDGVDGCVAPNGPALPAATAQGQTLLFAFDTPADSGAADTHADLFALTLAAGTEHVVGRTQRSAGHLTDSARRGVPVGPASVSHSANPEGVQRADGTLWLFYDDENVRDDLFFSTGEGTWLDARWSAERKIPAPVSEPDVEESQPFFDGAALYFRRETTLYRSRYQGGDMAQSVAWAAVERVLDGDRQARAPGEIFAVGEPSIATVDGRRELYFVFAEKAPDGSLNLDVGRVAARTAAAAAAPSLNALPAEPIPTVTAGHALPLARMQGVAGTRSATVQHGISGAAGGEALVWAHDLKPGADALLLLPAPAIPASSRDLTVSAYSPDAITLGVLVSEKGGARYAVQLPWPAGRWHSQRLRWQDFAWQAHGAKDTSRQLEPAAIDALLLIDVAGGGPGGARELRIDGLLLDAAP